MRASWLLLLVLAGCSGSSDTPAPHPAPPPAAPEAPAEPSAEGQLDDRDQYALINAITRLQGVGDLDQLDNEYARIRSEWIGRRYRWEALGGFCERDRCFVNAVDYAKLPPSTPMQGWLPQIEWAEGEHDRLVEQCRGKHSCVVKLEATLADMTLSTDVPLTMRLSNARVLETREQREDEEFTRRLEVRIDPNDPAIQDARREYQAAQRRRTPTTTN